MNEHDSEPIDPIETDPDSEQDLTSAETLPEEGVLIVEADRMPPWMAMCFLAEQTTRHRGKTYASRSSRWQGPPRRCWRRWSMSGVDPGVS